MDSRSPWILLRLPLKLHFGFNLRESGMKFIFLEKGVISPIFEFYCEKFKACFRTVSTEFFEAKCEFKNRAAT